MAGLLKNKDVNNAYRRVVAKGTKRVSIVEVREKEFPAGEDGSPARCATFVPLRLEEDAKDTDGGDIKAGAVVDIAFNTSDNPNSDDKVATMNRISEERFRELVVAALRLPKDVKDVIGQLESAGGADALKGRVVVADFSPSKNGNNNINKFAALPEAS